MATGTVKWFNHSKTFEIIAPADGGRDVFLHFSAVSAEGSKPLHEGAKVEFETEEGKVPQRETQYDPTRGRIVMCAHPADAAYVDHAAASMTGVMVELRRLVPLGGMYVVPGENAAEIHSRYELEQLAEQNLNLDPPGWRERGELQ